MTEVFVVGAVAVFSLVVTAIAYFIFWRVRSGREGTLGSAVAATGDYLSRYLLCAIMVSMGFGFVTGEPATLFALPVLHFLAAIPMVPGALAINYVVDRWLQRPWSKRRAWAAGILTVALMWLISLVLLLGPGRPPAMLQNLLGSALSSFALGASVPMISSSVSLAVAWSLPLRRKLG